ncbi:MAG: NAD(P)H-dependent oxidoreductase [Betaproteobacteria bacterium]|nr:NAD(P)H-dependent oxidoreductase [Betaproteobacteria bacterium]
MIRIAIVTGSTRPGRKSRAVADWVLALAAGRSDAEYVLLDIADYQLPLLDESSPPAKMQYQHEHTKRWSAAVAGFDGFVFVTPEYNHGPSAALKNALDFLYREWNHKAAGFVSYGSAGGVRAVEQLRLVMGEISVADVRAQVVLTLADDFENYAVFKPRAHHEKSVKALLDQVVAWAGALQPLRIPGA